MACIGLCRRNSKIETKQKPFDSKVINTLGLLQMMNDVRKELEQVKIRRLLGAARQIMGKAKELGI